RVPSCPEILAQLRDRGRVEVLLRWRCLRTALRRSRPSRTALGLNVVDDILRRRRWEGTSSIASFANGIEHCGEAAPSSCLSCRTAVNPSLEAACAPSLARTLRQDRHDEDTADTP